MILVTGGSGFLGKHLVRHLAAQGQRVRALYNAHPPTGPLKDLPGVDWVKCDLLDIFDVEEVMQGVTDIYHCAAIVTFNVDRRDEMLHFNPESTANIVNQAIVQGIRKMVHVSSIAAIGRAADVNKEITEDEEWTESKYNSAYGSSKYLAEMEAWRGIGEGLDIAIVNPGIILGDVSPQDLAAQLMNVVYKEFPFYSGGVNAWVDVKDVVNAMVMLMGSAITAERFIVSAASLPYLDVFTMMANGLNKKPPRIFAGPFLTGMAWRLSMLRSALLGKSSIITRETVNNSNAVCYYNNDKLLKALPGFAYSPLKQTIQDMARSFTENSRK